MGVSHHLDLSCFVDTFFVNRWGREIMLNAPQRRVITWLSLREVPVSPEDNSANLGRRELQLALFACLVLLIIATGAAVLMYPVVFLRQDTPSDSTLRIAFLGFCVLCVLLTAYLWDSQATIRRLRRQVELDSKEKLEARQEAYEDLLKSIPKLSVFQDRLPMEHWRSTATEQPLSILVVNLQLPADPSSAAARISILGDAAKAISRKLRDQDSIYVLGGACFGAVLPGAEATVAGSIASRVAEGLIDTAGVTGRFSHKIDIVNFPQNASSAHEIQEAVCALIPLDSSKQELAEALT
jgi:GGDEF domain-containing protein